MKLTKVVGCIWLNGVVLPVEPRKPVLPLGLEDAAQDVDVVSTVISSGVLGTAWI
jgi:hypothetical protein